MKKVMMVLACMSTALLQGMENPDNNTLSFLINKTTVKLTKGCMFDADGTVDLMIVGRVQQRQLQTPTLGDSLKVGRIDTVRGNMIYIKNKDDESASGDDTYKSFVFSDDNSTWKRSHTKTMQSSVLSVIEPRICMEDDSMWLYNASREDRSVVDLYTDDKKEVIEEAKKDLAFCYKMALLEGLKKQKSIAIPALGTDVGFPREDAAPVAVTTIIDFIKNNTDGYQLIHLFVKKGSELAWYKELLAEYAVEQK